VLHDKIASKIDEKINEVFSTTVQAQLDVALAEAVNNSFDRAYIKVTSFGQKEGGKTTIRRELERLIEGYWSEKVDAQGRPSSYGSSITRAEYYMMRICGDDFSKHMQQHVVNVGGALKDHFRAQLQRTVDDMLGNVFKVNSLD